MPHAKMSLMDSAASSRRLGTLMPDRRMESLVVAAVAVVGMVRCSMCSIYIIHLSWREAIDKLEANLLHVFFELRCCLSTTSLR
jgi:hypothetical protein